MQIANLFLSIVTVIFLAGCGHPISIRPDITKIELDNSAQAIPKRVGYYFLGDREKEVSSSSPTDPLVYKPYKDIEKGFGKILQNVFMSVTPLASDKDPAISQNEIDYVIGLEVLTNSVAANLLSYAATGFTVKLSCDIQDNTGKRITNLTAVGEGSYEASLISLNNIRFSDPGLAGKRASQDALMKMQRLLLTSAELRGASPKVSPPAAPGNAQNDSQSAQSKEKRLQELKRLHDAGLISKEIYLKRQNSILESP